MEVEGALGRFDGSFREDKTRSRTTRVHTIKPTYVPTISVSYTPLSHAYTRTHIYTYEHTKPPPNPLRLWPTPLLIAQLYHFASGQFPLAASGGLMGRCYSAAD